jgi:hypothetical protein
MFHRSSPLFVCQKHEKCTLPQSFPMNGLSLEFSSVTLKQQEKAYLLTHGAEPFLKSLQWCSRSRTSQHFLGPEGSIPCSQEPSIGPYPKPYQSNPTLKMEATCYFETSVDCQQERTLRNYCCENFKSYT